MHKEEAVKKIQIGKKEILSYAAICMNLEDTMISEISQSQKDTYCIIPLIEDIQSNQAHKKRVGWRFPGAGGQG